MLRVPPHLSLAFLIFFLLTFARQKLKTFTQSNPFFFPFSGSGPCYHVKYPIINSTIKYITFPP